MEPERVDLSTCTPLVRGVASMHDAVERRESRREHILKPTCTGSTALVAYKADAVEWGRNSAIVPNDRGVLRIHGQSHLGRRRDRLRISSNRKGRCKAAICKRVYKRDRSCYI